MKGHRGKSSCRGFSQCKQIDSFFHRRKRLTDNEASQSLDAEVKVQS